MRRALRVDLPPVVVRPLEAARPPRVLPAVAAVALAQDL